MHLWFACKYIEAGCGQMPRLHGIDQCFFIHQGSPASIDQDRIRLHGGNGLGIHNVVGVVIERAVN